MAGLDKNEMVELANQFIQNTQVLERNAKGEPTHRNLTETEQGNFLLVMNVLIKAFLASNIPFPFIYKITSIILDDTKTTEPGSFTPFASISPEDINDLQTKLQLGVSMDFIVKALQNFYQGDYDRDPSLAGLFVSFLHEIAHIKQVLESPNLAESATDAANLIQMAHDPVRREILFKFAYFTDIGEQNAWIEALDNATLYSRKDVTYDDNIDEAIKQKLLDVIDRVKKMNDRNLRALQEYIEEFLQYDNGYEDFISGRSKGRMTSKTIKMPKDLKEKLKIFLDLLKNRFIVSEIITPEVLERLEYLAYKVA